MDAIPKEQQSDRDSSRPMHSGGRVLVIASLIVASVNLLQCLALTYFIVRVRPYPAEANDYNWAVLGFPVIPMLLLVGLSRARLLHLDVGYGLASLLLGFLLSVPLAVTFGLWFHFAIGGTL